MLIIKAMTWFTHASKQYLLSTSSVTGTVAALEIQRWIWKLGPRSHRVYFLVKWSLSVMSDSLWPHDWGLPGSSIHGIFQARILKWVSICFSRGSSQPRDRTQVSRVLQGMAWSDAVSGGWWPCLPWREQIHGYCHIRMWVESQRRLSTEELILLNCGAEEDSFFFFFLI